MNVQRLGAVLVAILLLGSGATQAAFADVTVEDASGRRVRIADASRILSIGGDVTEILYALGAGDRIAAVDTTSKFPPPALLQKSVGYMRALSSEGVIAVGATVVLASERAGPAEVVKTLKATSVPYVEVPDEYSADGIAKKVRLIARVIGAEALGDRIAAEVVANFAALAGRRARIHRPVRALFVLGVQNGRVLVGGKHTSADAMLALAGALNAATAVHGFRPLADEALIELAPEVIIGMRGSGDSDTHDLSQLLALKAIQSTPAGASRRLILMDGLYLLGFGPRAPDAAGDLMRALYPDIDAEAGRQ